MRFMRYCGMSRQIVFIHGVADITKSWRRLAPLVENIGYSVDFFEYKTLDRQLNLTTIAQQLAEFIDRRNYTDLVLMGHSQGGLVAEWYDHFLTQDRPIEKIITIATPYHGNIAPALTQRRLLALAPISRAQLKHLSFCSEPLRRLMEVRRLGGTATPYFAIAGMIGKRMGYESDGVVPVVSANRNAIYHLKSNHEYETIVDSSTRTFFIRKNHLPASFLYGSRRPESEFMTILHKILLNHTLKDKEIDAQFAALIIQKSILSNCKFASYKSIRKPAWSVDEAYCVFYGNTGTLETLRVDGIQIDVLPGRVTYILGTP